MSNPYQAKFEEEFQKFTDYCRKKDKAGAPELTDKQKLSKEISQLLAQSWLEKGVPDSVGFKIRQALLDVNTKTTPKEKSDNIKAAFLEGGVDITKLWDETAIFLVDWTVFMGRAVEGGAGSQDILFYMPYPPRPLEVTDDQLMNWVQNKDTETIHPPYAYIPYSTL